MDTVIKQLLSPVAQAGAFGICLVLAGLIFWLIRRMFARESEVTKILTELQARTMVIITENTDAIRNQTKLTEDNLHLQREIQTQLVEVVVKMNGVKT